MRRRISAFLYWLFAVDLFLVAIRRLEAICEREQCRICGEHPAISHGACEKCYIEECEESEDEEYWK